MDTITRLYPTPHEELPLQGVYLKEDLLGKSQRAGKMFVFTNYITSLDGRIAISHPSLPGMTVPQAIANPRDWRLFQELQAQADAVITSGRYLRDYADGRAQEILKVYENPAFADLAAYREEHGFKPLQDLIVLSAGLDFPLPKDIDRERMVVVTAASAGRERIAGFKNEGIATVIGGEDQVEGNALRSILESRGFRTVLAASGPKVFHTLLAAGAVHRLYLTQAHRILGGEPFSSVVQGGLLVPAADLRLRSLYLDADGLDGLGQTFASYDILNKGRK